MIVENIHPVYFALFALILIDVLTGIAKAFITRDISSDASRQGMTKKAVMLLLVAAAKVSERLLDLHLPVDLGQTLAMFYIITEVTSILENAKACGVPLPDSLMSRFKSAQEKVNGTNN